MSTPTAPTATTATTARHAAPRPTVEAPAGTASVLTTIEAVAVRTALKLLRSPQVLGIALVQSVLFLVMFRYVLGGAIGGTGISYVDYLIPGVVVSGLIFSGAGGAVAVAEEAAGGLYDRLRSLPVVDLAVLAGRALTDAVMLFAIAVITLGIGWAIGFRSDADPLTWVAALALLALFAVAVSLVFVWVGLASGSAQAANGLGLLGIPLSFLSSSFVPIESMPAVVQGFAQWQPLTFFINAWRGLVLGPPTSTSFDHPLAFYVVGSVVWSVAVVAMVAPLALRAYRKD